MADWLKYCILKLELVYSDLVELSKMNDENSDLPRNRTSRTGSNWLRLRGHSRYVIAVVVAMRGSGRHPHCAPYRPIQCTVYIHISIEKKLLFPYSRWHIHSGWLSKLHSHLSGSKKGGMNSLRKWRNDHIHWGSIFCLPKFGQRWEVDGALELWLCLYRPKFSYSFWKTRNCTASWVCPSIFKLSICAVFHVYDCLP